MVPRADRGFWMKPLTSRKARPDFIPGDPLTDGQGVIRSLLRPSILVPRTTEGRPRTWDQPFDPRRDGQT